MIWREKCDSKSEKILLTPGKFLLALIAAIYKGVARLQFKRRQSGQVKRRRGVSRGAQDAQRVGVWGRGVALPAEEGLGRELDPFRRKLFIICPQNGAFWCCIYAGFNGRNKDLIARRGVL